MNYSGEEFINKIYKDLINDYTVQNSGNTSNKNEQLRLYFERLDNITNKAIKHDKLDRLKELYYSKYVIKKENIKEEYFQNQEKIALERGYGHVHYDAHTKEKEIESIINEQKESLSAWIEYFASEDTKQYPTWFKYFCFQGVTRIGYLDKKTNKFSKRTESTIKPFIEINREAIAYIYDYLVVNLNKKEIEDKELEKLINGGSFAKIYSYVLKELDSIEKDDTKSEEGIWKKYLQNSDPNILFNDIHGKGTGWCTAGGIETARSHLNGGDFYVYYTKDKENNYTNPRIAIRMENGKIAEIRGIGPNQNMESNMEKVVDKKLEEFPDKEEYKKKVKDMEMLTHIYTKWQNKGELTKEDLTFLYEINDKIIGFGFQKDPRIKEIINTRDIRKDLSYTLDCHENEISLTEEEALEGNKKYHYGDLNFTNSFFNKKRVLPEIVNENNNSTYLSDVKKIILPETYNGDLWLTGLTSIECLALPKTLNGDLYLNSLINIDNIILPENFSGDVYVDGEKISNSNENINNRVR